jgi:ABC-type nickel/cobalt efflux system permease component RcnA
LIPDHWLPFVLVGRARGWSLGRTALLSGSSAIVHTALSVALGLVAVAIGIESAGLLGERLEAAAGLLLIVFGLVYAAWAWRKGGHFHPGGALLHRRGEAAVCDGEEGEHREHLHYHADAELIREPRARGDVSLALIVGLNPCVLVLPLLLAAARNGASTVAAVSGAYCVTTVLLMVGMSVAGVRGLRALRIPAFARHMEAISGLLIAVLGILVWLFEG